MSALAQQVTTRLQEKDMTARHIKSCLVRVQPSKSHPNMT